MQFTNGRKSYLINKCNDTIIEVRILFATNVSHLTQMSECAESRKRTKRSNSLSTVQAYWGNLVQ